MSEPRISIHCSVCLKEIARQSVDEILLGEREEADEVECAECGAAFEFEYGSVKFLVETVGEIRATLGVPRIEEEECH